MFVLPYTRGLQSTSRKLHRNWTKMNARWCSWEIEGYIWDSRPLWEKFNLLLSSILHVLIRKGTSRWYSDPVQLFRWWMLLLLSQDIHQFFLISSFSLIGCVFKLVEKNFPCGQIFPRKRKKKKEKKKELKYFSPYQ